MMAMNIDHTRGCANFRDVWVSLSLLHTPTALAPGRLLRGGKLDFVESWDDIERPRTILSLRGAPDPPGRFPARLLHMPRPNDQSCYQTQHRAVRAWLARVLAAIAEADLPVLVHCTSGKDRTGVVVAAVLHVLGVEHCLIAEEFLLSDGEVRREQIAEALGGMARLSAYLSPDVVARLSSRLGPG